MPPPNKTRRILIVTSTFVFVWCISLFSQQQKSDSLLKLLHQKPGDYKLNVLYFDALKKTNPDSASRFVTQILIGAEDRQDSLFIGMAYNFKASLYLDGDNTREAIPFYSKSLSYTKNRKDSAGASLRANTYRNYGLAMANSGRYIEAEPLLQNSLNIYLQLKDSVSIASTYLVYGQLEKDRGNYEKALRFLFLGLEVSEKKNDNKSIGRLLNNIANVYLGQGKYADAITYYKQALSYKIKVGQKGDIGNTYGNIGVAFFEQKKYDTALVYYRMALPLKALAKDKKGTASTLNNIGLVYIEKANYDSAGFYIWKALDLRKEINDESGIASSENAMARIYIKTENYKKAIPLLENSIAISRKNGASEALILAYDNAIEAYAKSGDYKTSYTYGKLYRTLYDSIENENIIQQTGEMKAKYESDKQEEQIKKFKKEQVTNKLIQYGREATERQRKYIVMACALIALLIISFLILRQRENRKTGLILQKAFNEIEAKNKSITDSIRYAKRIQQSILPNDSDFKRVFSSSFVYYNPKDIVSGDFYWIHVTPGGQKVIAVADCTGHGVPGAFMSVMGGDILSQATKNKNIDNPAAALHFLDEGVRQQLKQTGGNDESRDGMDIAMGLLDEKTGQFQFAGALRPLIIVRNGKLLEFAAARYTIGGAFDGEKKFSNHDIRLEKGDMIYLFTDGFGDQFGGPKGKKFKTARLKELFVSISHLSEAEQRNKLEENFNAWKNDLEQVDDVCVVGIRV